MRTLGSLSLAWVGDGSGVSVSHISDNKKKRVAIDCFLTSAHFLLGAPSADNISCAGVHDAFRPVQPVQEVSKSLYKRIVLDVFSVLCV